MDWKILKDKARDLGSKAAIQAFAALEKTAPHVYEGIKNTPVRIKDGVEFDAAKSSSVLVVFVLGKEDSVSKAAIVRIPLLLKDAWICSANLKVILAEESPELVAGLQVAEIPAAFVYRKGELEKTFLGAQVSDFIKSFDLSRPKEATTAPIVPEGKTDVLSEAVATETPSESKA